MYPRVLILLFILGAAAVGAQTPAPPGFTVTPVLDNATVSVNRLRVAPGAREQPHTHLYPMLVVMLSRGDLDVYNGTTHTKGPRTPGDLEFFGAGVLHAIGNGGTAPLEGLVLALKQDRVRGGAAPPSQALPGLSRKSILDNSDVSVTRLEFEPEVREAVHTHPYDLLVVPTTAARLDVQLGTKKEVRSYAVGEAIFVPRGAPHAIANVGTASFRVLGIAIK